MRQAVTGTHMPIQYATSPCLWGRVSVFSSNEMPQAVVIWLPVSGRRWCRCGGHVLHREDGGGGYRYVDCALPRRQGVLQPAHLHQQLDEHRDEDDD